MSTTLVQDSPATERLYHIGLTRDCPVDNVTAGGQALCKMTEIVSFNRAGETKRNEGPGQTVSLTDEQVKRMVEAVDRLSVRTTKHGRTEDSEPHVTVTVVQTGERKTLARYRVTVDESTGIETKHPVYETRRQKNFNPSTDKPLRDFVFFEPVEVAPERYTPTGRLPSLERAEAAKPALTPPQKRTPKE